MTAVKLGCPIIITPISYNSLSVCFFFYSVHWSSFYAGAFMPVLLVSSSYQSCTPSAAAPAKPSARKQMLARKLSSRRRAITNPKHVRYDRRGQCRRLAELQNPAHRLVASTPVTYSYRPTPAAAGQGRADESVCPCRQGRPAPVACGQERCSIGMARRVTGGRANYHSIVPAKRDLPSPLSPRPILPRKTLIACRPPATSIPIRIRMPLWLAW